MNMIGYAAAIIGIVTGIAGIIFGLQSNRQLTLQVVKMFFEESDALELSDKRKKLYDSGDSGTVIDVHDRDVRCIIAFYEKWSILEYKGYLPIWVFEGAAGAGVIKQFDILDKKILRENNEMKSYFDERRVYNKFYGKNFERLTNKIKNKYPELLNWKDGN